MSLRANFSLRRPTAVQLVATTWALCVALATSATTIQWGAGFPGFQAGDVWFGSTVEYGATGLNRGLTLFAYSPATDRISEVMPVPVPAGAVEVHLAFDTVGRGLFIADTQQIQLLRPDGSLVPFATDWSTLLDIAVDADGSVFAASSNIRRYTDGVGTFVASLGTPIRGLAVVPGGFVAAIDRRSELYGNDNLLWLSPNGAVIRREHLGAVVRGGAGLVRARPDGTLVAVADRLSGLYAVSSDGSSRLIGDETHGIFQTDGIAVDTQRGMETWVTTRGRPASLQAFGSDGTVVTHVALELEKLGYPGDKGFFSPSGVACVPATSDESGAPPPSRRPRQRRSAVEPLGR